MEQTGRSFHWKYLWTERKIVLWGMMLLVPMLYAAGVPGMRFLFGCLFLALMLFVSAMDFRYGLIFNRFLLAMGLIGTALDFAGWLADPFDGVAGAFLGSGLLLLVRWASRGGMGGGDVKYAFVLGLWLGWEMMLLALFLSFLAGGVAAAFLICCHWKENRVPFGPFLSMGGCIAFLYGSRLLQWYEGFFP